MTTTEVEAQSARSFGTENGRVGHGIAHVTHKYRNGKKGHDNKS